MDLTEKEPEVHGDYLICFDLSDTSLSLLFSTESIYTLNRIRLKLTHMHSIDYH